LISCFPGIFLRYFLNDFEIVPVDLIITGITFVFTFHMRSIYVAVVIVIITIIIQSLLLSV
jgi:hypothetical protein